MSPENGDLENAVLILTPSGRDASLAANVLEEAGIAAAICADGDALVARMVRAGAAICATNALSPAIIAKITAVLAQQPPWSDFPFLIFTERAATTRENERTLETFAGLGNVTALERPLHPLTMISAARAALRARARQYAARSAIEQREREVRQRDQFLAMLGHELRNPLGAMQNAAQLAQRSARAVPRLEHPLAVIDRQLHHLTRLVDDLLDVARVTSGKIALQRAPLDFGALCFGLVEESRGTSRERGLTLVYEEPPGPVYVDGDRVRLEQIVNNLLTNALKYTPSGGRIVVSVTASDAGDEEEAVLRVDDTGTGIAVDNLRAIFEPFTQSEQTLDRAQGGMGLGLSVVRTLVQLHGGTVSAASAGPGRGTSFTVRLPLAAALASDDLTPISGRDVHPRVILIVEDGADNRETLQELLEALGHTVHVAADGVEGVDVALSVRPEVALVDIGLPRLDGFEVARRVRAALGRQIFLVALTGYGQPEDRTRAAVAGFDAHLTKPMDLDALERMLATLAPDARVAAGIAANVNRR